MSTTQPPIIPSDAVRAIQDSVKTETMKVGGETFTTRPVFLPPAEPLPAALQLNTLTGLVEYVNNRESIDGAANEGLAVHVLSETEVRVVSGLQGRHSLRAIYAVATADSVLGACFRFGEFMDAERFNIALQSLFAETDERAGVLKIVGNIKDSKVVEAKDDGVTQQVTARTGIALVTEVDVPNPVELTPFRTFREIEQPPSPFVLRVRPGREGTLPQVALFEADGGQWKLAAIEAIRDYLKESVEGVLIIA